MAKKLKAQLLPLKLPMTVLLKQVGQKAKGAKKGLDGVSKSAGDVNRNMQAMSGRVESGTKGFARMQQGTGGLVQSYAILASTLFAVGAAFRALRKCSKYSKPNQRFPRISSYNRYFYAYHNSCCKTSYRWIIRLSNSSSTNCYSNRSRLFPETKS